MPFLELSLELGPRDPAPFEDALFELGAISVTLEDAADEPVLEPAPGATPLWPTVRLKALFEGPTHGPAVAALDRRLRARLPQGPEPALRIVEDRPWEREWLRDFRPMRFGRRLWICPGGEPAGEADAVRVELDPGLAFGTGTHATTRLCLEWLDGQPLEGATLIDYGCGSGVLGIAAARLGAGRVIALDIDPQALIATRDNALRNSVTIEVLPAATRPVPGAPADVLVANILAGPLAGLAPHFAALVRPGGRLALSGILEPQVPAVTEANRPWFDIGLTATLDGWALLSGRRLADPR